MTRNRAGHYVIDIRDQRVGRVTLSSRTRKVGEYRRRESAVRALIERGEVETLAALRDRANPLHIVEVTRAHREGTLDALRPGGRDLVLGPAVAALLASVKATKAANTHALYRSVLRRFVARFGAKTALADITSTDIERWLHEPKGKNGARKPWAPRTQATAHAVLGRLFNQAVRREAEKARPALRKSPTTNVERPEVRPTRVEFLRPEEWRTLIKAVAGTPQAAWLGVGALAGLRAGEAAHLRSGLDVDLDARVLHVQSREGLHPWRPKTKRGERTVPISAGLHALLVAHRPFMGARYVFRLAGRDEPLNHDARRRWTKDAFEAGGVAYGRRKDALTHHSLRHSFASWLVQRDVQILKVAELLGDRAAEVERTYAHLLPRDLEATVRIIDEVSG